MFQISFDTASVTKALKSELNMLQRSLFTTAQTEREYFSFERFCQTCPVLCLLSEASWSFFRRKECYWMEERKGDNRPAGNNLSKPLDKNSPVKESRLETVASCVPHTGNIYAEPSAGSHLRSSSVTTHSVPISLGVKLRCFVGPWSDLYLQGAANICVLGEHKSKSDTKESSNHLGLYNTGIGRNGAAYRHLQNSFEDR